MIDLPMIDRDYRLIGSASIETWKAEFTRVKSPLLPHVISMHEAAGPHSALCLAMMWLENQYATTGIIIQPEDRNPLSMRPWLEDPTATIERPVIDWETRDFVFALGEQMTIKVPPYCMGAILADDNSMMLRFGTPAAAVIEWRRRIVDDRNYKEGVYNAAKTLTEMLNTYAPPGDVHPETGVDNSEIGYPKVVRTMLTRYAEMEGSAPPEKEPKMNRPYVLLRQGHRDTSGGNQVEAALTDDMSRAYVKEGERRGYEVDIVQEMDDDNDPNFTRNTLAYVAIRCRDILAARAKSHPNTINVLADLHYDGSNSVIHAIPPGIEGWGGRRLGSGWSWGAPGSDTTANNILDVKVGGTWARLAKEATGYGVYVGANGTPGIMMERETGVGRDGWRLGILGGTAPVQASAVRLVLEHGGTGNRHARSFDLWASVFFDALDEVFEQTTPEQPHPEPNPEPTYAQPVPPSFWDALMATGATHAVDKGTYWFRTDARYRVKTATKRQQFAVEDDRVVGPSLDVGDEFEAEAVGESASDNKPWSITSWITRIALEDLEYVGPGRAGSSTEE